MTGRPDGDDLAIATERGEGPGQLARVAPHPPRGRRERAAGESDSQHEPWYWFKLLFGSRALMRSTGWRPKHGCKQRPGRRRPDEARRLRRPSCARHEPRRSGEAILGPGRAVDVARILTARRPGPQ